MRHFEIVEARRLLPTVRGIEAELVPVRAELAVLLAEQAAGSGHVADIKGLEARMSELLDVLTDMGIEIKGYAPLLVDFPHQHAGRDLLLCWLEGEDELAWYHDAAHGFMGRRPISEL